MKLLIVDDEKDILDVLQRNFQLVNIPCDVASSAENAISMHKNKLYNIVLTDIKMPGMNGTELVSELKRIQPATIVYMMTGFASLTSMVDCLGRGATDYFLKPFESLDELTLEIQLAQKRYQRWMKDLIHLKKGNSA